MCNQKLQNIDKRNKVNFYMYNKIVLFCSFQGKKKKSQLQFIGVPIFMMFYSSVSLDTCDSLRETHALYTKSHEWHLHTAEDTLTLRCARHWHCGNIKTDSN